MNKYVLSIQQTCLIPHVIRKDIIDRKILLSAKTQKSIEILSAMPINRRCG